MAAEDWVLFDEVREFMGAVCEARSISMSISMQNSGDM